MMQDQTKRAKTLRKNLTDTEKYLWYVLQRKNINGFKFRRQQPIGRYIVDFVCLPKKLIVELDGGHHAKYQKYTIKKETSGLKVKGSLS